MADGEAITFDRTIFGPPDIGLSEFKLGKKIGGGCFGAVYEGECRGKKVAIKKLFKQDLNEGSLSEFKKEVELCSRLNHPNVLLFMGACTVPGEMAIITELCERGNLETLLHNKRADLTLYRRMVMAKETASGMAWLHGADPQIIHRDIKPSNLLVDKHGQIKVCDFGLSVIKPVQEKLQDTDSIPGSPLWMPPEVMLGRKLDEKCDVYSYAIVLWEIVTQQAPFPDAVSFPEFREEICVENKRPPLDNVEVESIKVLLRKCWHKDPRVRPSFEEISTLIDDILVDCAIKDETGREFWKIMLPGKEYVPFEKFLEAFLSFTKFKKPAQVKIDCMRMLLATKYQDNIMKPEDVVNIQDFGKILNTFGPFSHSIPRDGKKDKPVNLFDRIAQTCKQPWFHGIVSAPTAKRRLVVHQEGYYLVRLSSSVSGCFTISRVVSSADGPTVNHHRVDYRGNDCFSTTVNGKVIKGDNMSLRAFLSLIKGDMGLTKPCSGSEFQVLFKEKVAVTVDEGDGYGDPSAGVYLAD